ncbi:MAG: hypothetical protein RQ952_05830 [Thermoproteota archaeon]|nr:hypothetical protein [Thermoproteota archaeon]
MRAVSAAVGSLFLAFLIISFTFLFVNLTGRTFDSLSNFIMNFQKEKEKNEEKLFVIPLIDRFLPSKITLLNYTSYSGNLINLLKNKGLILSSNSGSIALKIYFENITSYSDTWIFEMNYSVLSSNQTTVTLRISTSEGFVFKQFNLTVSDISGFSFLDIIIRDTKQFFQNNSLELIISLNSSVHNFLLLNLRSLSFKAISNGDHYLSVYVFNESEQYIMIKDLIIFNSENFEYRKSSYYLSPLGFQQIIIKTSITEGYLKLITQIGNVYVYPITN